MVVSIHQPRYDVFALLDDVILLARGRLVWSGNSADMLKHFAALGHPCPPLTNPADFILDISSIDVSLRCFLPAFILHFCDFLHGAMCLSLQRLLTCSLFHNLCILL